ncbi:4-hydroxythreonine-4-phosphate dehydrogenase PdxA, partial [Bradyrhizobium campsiandrae]
MKHGAKTIALTIGDPNGIGPEIAVKAAVAMRNSEDLRVILIGDEHIIRHYGGLCAPDVLFQSFTGQPSSDGSILLHPVAALPSNRFRPGQVDADAGRATVAYVDAAIGLIRSGQAHAIVGCPHSETAVNAAGIPFSGYPGLIARLTHTPEERVFMMLIGGGLRILHATLHERIHHALARLTPELIEQAGLACATTLR